MFKSYLLDQLYRRVAFRVMKMNPGDIHVTSKCAVMYHGNKNWTIEDGNFLLENDSKINQLFGTTDRKVYRLPKL
jgi:hypothetical protein